MPVVNFHLVEGHFNDAQAKTLLVNAAGIYAHILDAPIERIRAFITPHPPSCYLANGNVVSENHVHAPFFEFFVLEGRTLEQRQYFIKAFTELLADTLAIDKQVIRGYCTRVLPEEWGIGGEPASEIRKAEIAARAATANN